jgi:HSP20 family molecular chaperone IbpA
MARKLAGVADTPPRSLLGLLGRLLIQLDSNGDVPQSGSPSDQPLERWEDDAYLYLEARLPDVQDRDVDVCVHDGKVVIRMEK